MAVRDFQERAKSLLMDTYGRYPLAVQSAYGSTLVDFEGHRYCDLLSGIAVCVLGHCHPELTACMQEQAGKLVHTSNLFFQREQLDLAELLLATCDLDRVFFCNSGAEANEGAIKLARRYMRSVRQEDRYEIITLAGSFHGRTLATLTATGQDKVKDGFSPLPDGFCTVPFADFDALAGAVNEKTAAVMLEVVQGEGGIRMLPELYLREVKRLCQEKGILLIVDEVQTGMGRTGRYWAHQHFGLTPDIMTSAKALAGGLPMGAVLATREVARGFVPGSHATTFGGSPFVSAAAIKVLQIIERDRLVAQAEELGEKLRARLVLTQERCPGKIVQVRILGLMIGIELAFDGQEVWNRLLGKGFVVNLTQGRVLRLLPALTISFEQLDQFCSALEQSL